MCKCFLFSYVGLGSILFTYLLFSSFKVGVDGLTYAGCHGLKIIHPDGQRYIHHVEQVNYCFYRVCHGFRFTTQDDYFGVDF